MSWLLEHGADPNIPDGRGFTSLHSAAELGLEDIVLLLLRHGARTEIVAAGYTAAALAETRGHANILGLLAEHRRH